MATSRAVFPSWLLRVRSAPPSNSRADDIDVIILRCGVQGSEAVLLTHVGVGTEAEQQFDDAGVFAGGCRVERSGFERIACRRVERCAGPSKIFGRVILAEIASQSKRLETVLGVGVDQLWIPRQQTDDVVDLAGGRGFEDRQHDRLIGQEGGKLTLSVIGCHQDGT